MNDKISGLEVAGVFFYIILGVGAILWAGYMTTTYWGVKRDASLRAKNIALEKEVETLKARLSGDKDAYR
jgi:hypothetical protein